MLCQHNIFVCILFRCNMLLTGLVLKFYIFKEKNTVNAFYISFRFDNVIIKF